ncbi:hypothetical protein [Streptomyces albogriseolus]|uniref:hypothetical protein n=1 Tax=Streptomyces albogriseolus TaxID=1887 RepID=UPI003F49E405
MIKERHQDQLFEAAKVYGQERALLMDGVRDVSARVRGYIEDLEAVQRHCEQYFPIPDELTPADRIALRMARLLIQGHCMASPFLTRARFTLNGQDSPTLRSLLSGEPHAVRGSIAGFALTLAGRHPELGPVYFYRPRVTVDEEDGRRALAALEVGRGEGCDVAVRPVGAGCFRHLLRDAAPGSGWTPVPLELPGFTEPR